MHLRKKSLKFFFAKLFFRVLWIKWLLKIPYVKKPPLPWKLVTRMSLKVFLCPFFLQLNFWSTLSCKGRSSLSEVRHATLLKKRLQHRFFPLNFANLLKTLVFQKTSSGCFNKDLIILHWATTKTHPRIYLCIWESYITRSKEL